MMGKSFAENLLENNRESVKIRNHLEIDEVGIDDVVEDQVVLP